ncbi:hypothetical protein WJ18_25080 [Burkholderia vietnamiensis]|nr:hypothetical protein WJ18_25080 [Burkholderia vietnamiensis]CAG9188499.1 conserved hypothetical protein [Burkholderia vietnamiensis]CAG9221238.1 conserved hypothetical protein [Burkholderia vietnamiensis]
MPAEVRANRFARFDTRRVAFPLGRRAVRETRRHPRRAAAVHARAAQHVVRRPSSSTGRFYRQGS